MIQNDAELDQAVDCLKLMYRALASLRRDILSVNPQRFALFAEGPQDEIAKLQADIDDYTGRAFLATFKYGAVNPDWPGYPHPGSAKGLIDMADDFDAPLEELREYME